MVEKSDKGITNWTNNNGESVFMYACHWGHKELAEYMIDLGADCFIRDRWSNTTAHHVAVSGATELLRRLLQVEGTAQTLGLENTDGEKPLDIAVEANNKTMAELIKGAMSSSVVNQNP